MQGIVVTEFGDHFAVCGLDNFSLQIIDCVRGGEDLVIMHLEGVWQNSLATFQDNGNTNMRNIIFQLGPSFKSKSKVWTKAEL